MTPYTPIERLWSLWQPTGWSCSSSSYSESYQQLFTLTLDCGSGFDLPNLRQALPNFSGFMQVEWISFTFETTMPALCANISALLLMCLTTMLSPLLVVLNPSVS
ncbi:integrin beta-5 [Platysternon megacephalum]|uniref:Integrin beta-5 n=1 Tax=Platysternon megacephalum TaxID=55544 RepID=A0A4D9EAX0_9SAUR|nr:integrin beta-5 [Platysternon megacephalum]